MFHLLAQLETEPVSRSVERSDTEPGLGTFERSQPDPVPVQRHQVQNPPLIETCGGV